MIVDAVFGLRNLARKCLPARRFRGLRRAWGKMLKNAPLETRREYRRVKWDSDFQNQHFPINVVAIETVGNCNRECPYCPVSIVDKRKGRMPTETFERIILELKALDFKGEIFMHFFNEPLLDKRSIAFLKFIRLHLKDNFLKFVTNGDLLTLENAQEILNCGVDVLAVSMHDLEVETKSDAIRNRLGSDDQKRFEQYRFHDVENHEFDSRAGTIVSDEFKVRTVAPSEGCDKTEFIIDYMGDIHPCSEDIGQGYVLGNINENTLYEIWDKSRDRFRDHFTGNYCALCRKCAGLDA